jgi:hypothetical protein
MTNYQGKCTCEKIKFICTGEPFFTQYCHCQKCRDIAAMSEKEQDRIGYSFTAAYLRENFSITAGENYLEEHVKKNAKLLLCSACKSLIYGISLDPTKQGGIGVNVNNFGFNNCLPASFKSVRHTWYENHVVDFNDDLPKFKDVPKEQFGSGELME